MIQRITRHAELFTFCHTLAPALRTARTAMVHHYHLSLICPVEAPPYAISQSGLLWWNVGDVRISAIQDAPGDALTLEQFDALVAGAAALGRLTFGRHCSIRWGAMSDTVELAIGSESAALVAQFAPTTAESYRTTRYTHVAWMQQGVRVIAAIPNEEGE